MKKGTLKKRKRAGLSKQLKEALAEIHMAIVILKNHVGDSNRQLADMRLERDRWKAHAEGNYLSLCTYQEFMEAWQEHHGQEHRSCSFSPQFQKVRAE